MFLLGASLVATVFFHIRSRLHAMWLRDQKKSEPVNLPFSETRAYYRVASSDILVPVNLRFESGFWMWTCQM
jgi:hypothetical protein